MITDSQMRAVRAEAHEHTDRCFGRYEPCGEHHMHDDTCGSRPCLCRKRETPELVALLADYDEGRARLVAMTAARDEACEELNSKTPCFCDRSGRCHDCAVRVRLLKVGS